MASLTVTAKRQATLPAALCEELGVKAGDKIEAERRVVNGETLWVLRGCKPDWSWFGSARKYGKGKSHRWKDIRRSIARGWGIADRS
jgi:bifunctional DNA-binding transcriptional regulator/antitoxin component of YhaV-PrlF toxin-antitoxin module